MFTYIYLDNFLGISVPIEFDFISKSRNKEENSSVAKIEDGIYINKLIGIIGGNASGKTSILHAINTIGNLLTRPICQFDAQNKFNDIQKLLDKDPSNENQKLLFDFFNDYNGSTEISFQNLRRRNENTTFKIEMYISNQDVELSGYYTYVIILNGIKKRIEREFLGFRKKYKDNIEPIIEINDAKEGQVYYINRYFKNIADIDNNKKDNLEFKYKYIKTFVKHYIDNSANISTDSECNYKELKYIDWYKKSPNNLRTLAKVVDPKIEDVVIDTDNKYEELLFVLKDGSKITRNMLSTGTERFLNLIRYVNEIIDKNGVLLVDEIEMNLHKDLVKLIIRLFGELSNNNSQIIFTTLSPEIFDITNSNSKKIFKQDTIYILNTSNKDIKIDKLMNLKIDGERVKGDASVANLYKNKKISIHPDEDQIEMFLKNFEN
jgi:hypothetical protein